MITLIAAMTSNRCIGNKGQLVWRNKEDMARFKELTIGKVVIMGRKTWESIPEKYRPLPDRVNVVVTRQADYTIPDGVIRASTLESALEMNGDLMVIGGGEIYAAALARAERLELTEIDQDIEGDTFFPEFSREIWLETGRQVREGFAFVTYTRIR
jgi:dihydrofolate reductase